MNAPLVKTALILSSLLALSACGPSTSNGPAAATPASPAAPAVDSTKLALKTAGSKKIILDRVVDLRGYFVNFQNAEFKIVEGQQFVQWMDAQLPKLKMTRKGDVKVLVTDTKDDTVIILKLYGAFDTASEADQIPIGEGEKLPGEPPWHL